MTCFPLTQGTPAYMAFRLGFCTRLDRLFAAFRTLATYRTRENIKPQAARCGFLPGLVPLRSAKILAPDG
jgi:hypothetical protein